MVKEPMESIRAVQAIIFIAGGAGLEPHPLLESVGLDISQIQNMEARVPARSVMKLWDEVVGLTGREDLGLVIGQWYPRDPGNVVSELFFNSLNLGEGLAAASAYFTLVSEGHYPVVEESGGRFRLRLVTVPSLPQIHKPTAEAILSVIGKILLSFAEPEPVFELIRFRHASPKDTGPYVDHFRAPVLFDQDCNALVLKPGVTELPNPNANPAIMEILHRYAEDKALSLQPSPQLLEDVRTATIKVLHSKGSVAKEDVARVLGVGARTLQRRLSQTGTSFKEQLETVRREVSIECLQDPQYTILDTAFMTGYGDQGAFSRAFVRWFGVPPARYRRNLNAATEG